MAGRFPFDTPGGNRQQQPQQSQHQFGSAAQMRAALGLPPNMDLNEASVYLSGLQQHQQQHQPPRDMRSEHLRQLLIQEHIDRHLNEQRIRNALAGDRSQVEQPDLRALLLQQQLQAHQNQQRDEEYLRQLALLGGGGDRQQGAPNELVQQLALARHFEELRRQQQLHHQQQSQQHPLDHLTRDQREALFQQYPQLGHLTREQQEALLQPSQGAFRSPAVYPQLSAGLSSPLAVAQNPAAALPIGQSLQARSAAPAQPGPAPPAAASSPWESLQQAVSAAEVKSPWESLQQAVAAQVAPPATKQSVGPHRLPEVRNEADENHRRILEALEQHQRNRELLSMAGGVDSAATATAAVTQPHAPATQRNLPANKNRVRQQIMVEAHAHALNAVALAAVAATPAQETMPRLGTVQGLLEAAEESGPVEDAANALEKLRETEWKSDEELNDIFDPSVKSPSRRSPTDIIDLPNFKSKLPTLPEEPLYTEPLAGTMIVEDVEMTDVGMAAQQMIATGEGRGVHAQPSEKKLPGLMEYPYPVDQWWPTASVVQRERHLDGETTDEDDFVDSETAGIFRANEKKIRTRLATKVEPGVLEKLGHCRIHRIRSNTKNLKHVNTPEFVFCFQVTELYPNDIMVNCSKCGTWRHAACGGHHKPYSSREAMTNPFTAVCDSCYVEQKYLEEYPKGQQRVDRQRNELLRRALASSAAMRFAAYSKHSGTYKWPLGSVSATHIGGHTRSVHARHEKAERQWSDMSAKLIKGVKARVRTKELERLLVSIEDAENYTDRHNMLLFLLRDTERDQPIGFDQQPKNMFDPAEDDVALSQGDETSSTENFGLCARKGCNRLHRFDSIFCSDACGIWTIEMDLLRSLQDASDVHPSVLRLS